MDLNLHLLKPDQLHLIQDICKIEGPIYDHLFEGFEEVRDKIDLIILDDSTGYDMYIEDLRYEEEEIRERLRKEKMQREQGEFPALPNFDNPQNEEPLWLPFDGQQRVSPIPRWTRWDYSKNTDPVESFIGWKPGHGRMPALSSTIEFIIEDDEKSYAGGLTDYQLLQLDACLARIKWDRLRLISKTITGCYAVSKNRKHKRVYLFPDAITKHALGNGVDVNGVLAETFIHEMFHAYFDNTKAKGFIYEHLKRIVEIEEAVTECSMLLFLREFYPHYLPFAELDIQNKFTSGIQGLQCYGVGYYLYDQLLTYKSVKNLFKKYRKIQRAPRLSFPEVRDYICEVQSASPDAQKCVNYIVLLINYFNKLVGADMKHYAFNGLKYGWESQLVSAVLNYYVAKNSPTLAQMQTDFKTTSNPDFFEDLSVVHASGKEKEYNLDIQVPLSCGTTIVPVKAWKNMKGTDNMPRFINEVKRMYNSAAKTIDVEINVLR